MSTSNGKTNGSNEARFDIQAEMSSYMARREELIAHEKALRHDYAFRKSLSPTARKASAIVKKIRAYEAENVWKKVEEQEGDVFPGMSFTLAKERMEKTMLWQIVKKFPKGTLLHAHLEAMVDMDWLLDQALDTEGMHIFSPVPLTSAKAFVTSTIEFCFCAPSSESKPHASLYSADYKPGTLVPLGVAADNFPVSAQLGSNTAAMDVTPREAFRAWFKSRTTITPEESMKHHEGINLVWAKFQSVFRVIHGIIFYEPIFRRFLREILLHLYQDNCLWADIRMAFLMDFRQKDTGKILDLNDVVRVFGEVVDAYIVETRGEFWGARVIWTTIKAFDDDVVKASMDGCIAAKVAHPKWVAGFDLVGQEDLGRPYISHLENMLSFKQKCKEKGVEIPLLLHAGETLGDGNDTDNNLFDAVLLGTKRIGHGYSMYKHPHLMDLARKEGICLEVCPISNEILRLCASIMSHPLPAFLAHGVPTAISNDDPGILGQHKTSSLTHDFWQVLQAYDNVGLEGLGDLAQTSVKYAAFNNSEVGVVDDLRRAKLDLWKKSWEKFCQWVVDEYADWDKAGRNE